MGYRYQNAATELSNVVDAVENEFDSFNDLVKTLELASEDSKQSFATLYLNSVAFIQWMHGIKEIHENDSTSLLKDETEFIEYLTRDQIMNGLQGKPIDGEDPDENNDEVEPENWPENESESEGE